LIQSLQYLYLLFDEENPIHNDDSNYVFTTEGHIISLEQKYLKLPSPTVRRLRRAENQQCPGYEPPYVFGADDMPGLYVGIRSRTDFDYSRFLVSTALSEGDETWWHPSGWCTAPTVDLYVGYIHASAPSIAEISAASDTGVHPVDRWQSRRGGHQPWSGEDLSCSRRIHGYEPQWRSDPDSKPIRWQGL
jgi:hypothetical protein